MLENSRPQDVKFSETLLHGEEYLKAEYSLLNEWARHGEQATNQIFNFYVTLITTASGGLILISQLNPSNQSISLLMIGLLSVLMVVVGVVFFDALVTQYIRNAYYHRGILSIQSYFRRYPVVAATLQIHPPFSIEADAESPDSFISKRMPLLKSLLPVGIQQIFISLANSLLIGVVILCLSWGLGGIGFRLIETLVATGVGVMISFIVHNWFARRSMQDDLDQIKALAAKDLLL